MTPEIQEKVDQMENKAGNTIMILHADTESIWICAPEYFHVPSKWIVLQPLARIYEVLTFYNYFKLEPPAENTIQICTGTACYLKGAGDDWLRRCRIASDVAFQESSIVNTITHERWVRLLTRVAYIVAPKRLNPAISDIQSKLMPDLHFQPVDRVISMYYGDNEG